MANIFYKDSTMSEKKKFGDTKVGQFLKKAGNVLPEIAAVGLEIATGDITGAAEKVQDILTAQAKQSSEAKRLLNEWERFKLTYQKELIELDNADRDSARKREVEITKALNKRDWMHTLTGVMGLIFLSTVIWVGLFGAIEDREVFYHVLGLSEGIGLSIFVYYYGSSSKS